MAAESAESKALGMVPDEFKHEPRSKGLTHPRKKKPKELAVITECCTGCAGSPACVEYCPVEDCMFWVPDEDHPPFGRIQVDPLLLVIFKPAPDRNLVRMTQVHNAMRTDEVVHHDRSEHDGGYKMHPFINGEIPGYGHEFCRDNG